MAQQERLAVFRADASPGIGGGHVVRCLALAAALRERGWRCAFAVRPGTAETVPQLSASGHQRIALAGARDAEPGALAARLPDGADWLVVDHYERDADFQCACRPWARRLLVIDDAPGRRHDCDLLLDATPGRERDHYAAHLPAHCRLLSGPEHALLRPGFAAARAAALARRGPEPGLGRILVSFGMTDARRRTPAALRALRRAGVRVPIDVVLARPAADATEVHEMIAALPFEVTVHGQEADMPALMARADLALGAAGSTSWERCCLGLPAVITVDADNQADNARVLAGAGAALVAAEAGAELDEGRLAGLLIALASAPRRRASMARAAAALCDGRGAARVAAEMEAIGT